MDPAEAYPSKSPAQIHESEAPVVVKGKLHQFYLVKLRPYEDPLLESRIKEANGVIKTVFEARAPINEDFEFRKMDRDNVRCNMRWHRHATRQGDWPWERYMKRDLDHFRQSLQQLSSPNNEWEKRVKELKRGFVHGRPSHLKERQICNDLTHHLQTRQLIHRAQAEDNAQIIKRWGSKDELIQHIIQQIESIKRDLKARAERRKEDAGDYKCLQKKKAAIEKDLLHFKGMILDLNKQKANAHKCILDSTKLQATIRADYDEHVVTLNKAKELATKKDLMGLDELINRANERFMYKWSNEKRFREVYKNRIAEV